MIRNFESETIKIEELEKFKSTSISNYFIYDHKGQKKDSLYGLLGIPLKLFLDGFEYKYLKQKELNEFYFVLTASDGYKVVLSWNEIYNTEIGNNFFIITEMNGKRNFENDKRIIFLASGDLNTGRRFIKGLEKIEIKRIE